MSADAAGEAALPGRKTLLVTGFGRFPGAPFNPTERIVAQLGGAFARRLARLGWRLETAILPVAWDALPAELARLEAAHAPDAVLHLGLAARRRKVTIETRAHNRRRPLSFDAAGRRAATAWIGTGAEPTRRATIAVPRMVAALARATTAAPSIDAGAYLCNLALWTSLGQGKPGRPVAFAHVPKGGGLKDARACVDLVLSFLAARRVGQGPPRSL